MKCPALTGISPRVISDLKQGKPRTIELNSAHNIITLMGAEAGTYLFLTSIDLDDLSRGDTGIIVSIQSITVSMKRMVEYVNSAYYEEHERMSARVQVKYVGSTFVKGVTGQCWGEPTIVEVVKPAAYTAG